jgi:hypothetical protein
MAGPIRRVLEQKAAFFPVSRRFGPLPGSLLRAPSPHLARVDDHRDRPSARTRRGCSRGREHPARRLVTGEARSRRSSSGSRSSSHANASSTCSQSRRQRRTGLTREPPERRDPLSGARQHRRRKRTTCTSWR